MKTIFAPGKMVTTAWLNKSQYLGPGNPGVQFKANPVEDWEYPLLDSNSLNIGQLYNYFVGVSNSQTITGLKTFTAVPRIPTSVGTSTTDAINLGFLNNTLTEYVTLGSTQTVTGAKTFNSIKTFTAPSAPEDLINVQFFNNNTVKLTGAQAISGVKTFEEVRVTTPPATADSATAKAYVDQMVAQTIPPGVILPFAGVNAPAGFLLCDGAVLNTVTYSSLFAAIGYTFGGSGPGFNLPDLRGSMVLGSSALYPLANSGGSNNFSYSGTSGVTALTIAQTPTHTHEILAVPGTDSDPRNQPVIGAEGYFNGVPAFVTTGGVEGGVGIPTYFQQNAEDGNFLKTVGAGEGHTHEVSISVPNGNLSKYLALNFIIKI